MRQRRKRNPLNWAKHGWWFEAEGAQVRPPKPGEYFYDLRTVSQGYERAEIVETLCKELEKAGFHPKIIRLKEGLECALERIEEQKCFIERTKSYYLAEKTRKWAEEYLEAIERPIRKRRPRIPFTCP